MGGFFSGGGNSINLILILLMGVLEHPEHPPGYAPDVCDGIEQLNEDIPALTYVPYNLLLW